MKTYETQWNDAQIRFGPYDSTMDPYSPSDDNKHETEDNLEKEEEYHYGVNTQDSNIDREMFEFQFQIKLGMTKNLDEVDNKEMLKQNKTKHETEKPRMDTISLKLHGFQQKSNITYCSTGLTIWPAAEKICSYLVKRPNFIQEKRIVELGSGLGLCGLLAHHIVCNTSNNNDNNINYHHQQQQQYSESIDFASRGSSITNESGAIVHLTDGDTDTLSQLRKNIALNNGSETSTVISNSQNNTSAPSSISCNQLLWSRDNAERYLKEKANGQKFDVIIASDIIYAKNVVEPMWETVHVLLKQNGSFLFAFARRQVAVTMIDVVETGKLAGFEYEVCEETDADEHLFVYMFKRKNK